MAQQGEGLKFTAKLDTEEALRRAQELKKVLSDLKISSSGAGAGNSNATNFTQANVRMTRSIRDSLLETERLRQENIQLQNQWQRGAITLNELTARQRENTLARQEELRVLREARQNQVAANGSYREAQERLKALGLAIRNVAGGFNSTNPAIRAQIREYRELNARLAAFDRTMGNHQRNVGNYSSVLSSAGRSLSGLASTYLTAFAALAGVNAIIRNNAQISDSFSDVQRTAGLTTKEIDALVVSLKQIDTRTSLKSLLDIAIIGGQLGIAKEQLGGFTKAVDQLSVSLSGELQGGAEGIAKSLGVLNNVFGISRKEGGDVEKAFNKIGSVILGLGQSGLATGDFLTDFAERVGGVAAQANLSLPVLLSYGAVLQENGVSAEVAGTAFKKLIGSLATKREKFFAVAQIADSNLTLESFTKTINTDTAKALELFFNGLKKGGPTTTSFLDLLKSVGLDASRAGQSISALALHQEDLNKHIKESAVDYDEATKSTDQFRIKNENLAASLAKLQNEISEITTNPNSNLGDYFKRFVDTLTGGIRGIDIAIGRLKEFQYTMAIKNFDKSGQTGNFFIGVDDVKAEKARRAEVATQNEKNEALKIGRKLFHDAVLDIQANGDAVERLALEEGKLNSLRETYSKASKKDRNDVAKQLITQRELVNQLKVEYAKPVKSDGVTLTDNSKLTKSEQRRTDSLIDARDNLQKKIDALIDKSTLKQLSADDAEVESVRQKYKDMREEAEKFNNDPKNKKLGLRVDGGKIAPAEKSEVQAVYDKQSNERFKTQLAEQTKDFEAFENYKLKFGLEAAQKRYNAEFTTADAYAQKLEDIQTNILNKYGDPSGYSEAQKQELEIATNEIVAFNERKKALDDAAYAEVYQSAITFSQKMKDIDVEYERNKKALGEKATTEQLANLQKQRDDKKKSLNEENAYATSGYAQLMERFDELTRGEIVKRLNSMKESYRKQYQEGKINAEQLAEFIAQLNGTEDQIGGNSSFNEIVKSIKNYKETLDLLPKNSQGVKDAQKDMFSAISDGAADASQVVGALASSFQELGIGGEGLQDTLKNIGGVVDGLGGIAKGLSTGNPVDVVTGSIKLLTSAISLFDKKDKNLQKKIDGYKAQLDNLSKAYKQLERDVSNAVGNDIYDDQARQIENLRQQQELLIKQRQAERDKKKTDQGKVDAYTDQIDSIPGQIEDIEKAINGGLIQGSFRDLSNSLADALSDAFKAGEDGIDALDRSFNDFIANAIKNSLKLTLLEPVIAEFTKELTAYAKGNGNSVLGFDFESWQKKLQEAGEEFNKGLKESEQFFKPDENTGGGSSSLAKNITQITSDQANALEGITRGQYSLQKTLVTLSLEGNVYLKATNTTIGDLYNVAKSGLDSIAANTLRTANNTDRLKNIETHLSKMANTPGFSQRGAGLG